jgi:peptidoglycan/xylan/chitin deacetylase (PgdA/CDA1 family)
VDARQAAAAPSATDVMATPCDRAGIGAAALALAAAHAGPGLCAYSPALRRALAVRDGAVDGGAVALTFDDGPHARGTVATLERLRAERVRATFFLVGEQVRRLPRLAAEVAAAGHDIGVHCERHRNLLRLAPGQVRDDLLRAEDAVAAATGVVPRLYRPPYGVLASSALVHAYRRGWTTVLWTRWGRDWRARATPQSIAADAAGGLHGGEVVLLHDADHYCAPASWERTVAALPSIIERVHAAGLRCGAVTPAGSRRAAT